MDKAQDAPQAGPAGPSVVAPTTEALPAAKADTKWLTLPLAREREIEFVMPANRLSEEEWRLMMSWLRMMKPGLVTA